MNIWNGVLKWLVAATVVLSLGACDQLRQQRLEEGVSTEADVRLLFGKPDGEVTNADGTKTLEYSRQPMGKENFFMVIGADGKLTSMRQVLKAAEFAKIVAGKTKDEARKTLGRPAKTIKYDLKPDEDNWEWNFLDGQNPKVFIATFGKDNAVIRTQTIDDPAATMPGGK
jgi:uncharacterized lipoprotein YehR (DUF1307 family)